MILRNVRFINQGALTPQQDYMWPKEGNFVYCNLAKYAVMKFLQHGTDRDLATDNYFTSYTLSRSLAKENLTQLGAMRRHFRKVHKLMRKQNYATTATTSFLTTVMEYIWCYTKPKEKESGGIIEFQSYKYNCIQRPNKKTSIAFEL